MTDRFDLSAGYLLCAALALPLGGCSWSRFDDLASSTPVETLTRPSELTDGYGSSLATASKAGHAMLLVGGAPSVAPAAVYDLGSGTSPEVDAFDVNCTSQPNCRLSPSPAALGTAQAPGRSEDYCFVLGIGKSQNASGLSVRCISGLEYILTVPPEVETRLVTPELSGPPNALVPHTIVLGTDGQTASSLVAGARDAALAWFYAPLSMLPVPLPTVSPSPDGYGSVVTALAAGQSRIFAVAAPAAGQVWLYRTDDGTTASAVGCLTGGSHFGRAMAGGRIVGGEDTDGLVVADDGRVHVYDGAALAALAPTTATTCADAATNMTPLVDLKCGETNDVTGCADSGFGTALTVGDLDGDGDGEVIVGAPRMQVRGKSHAGAVLVFDVEPGHLADLAEAKYLSSAGSDDLLGSSLASPVLAGRSIVAAGAPGGVKVALFYCSDLLSSRGGRCP